MASEIVEDTSFDIAEYLGRDLGRAVGRVVAAALVSGSGSGEPNGAMAAAGVAGMGSVTTGGTLIGPTYETLVDTLYSVNDAYRGKNSGWLAKDSTMATVRKLRDGAGGTVGTPLRQPSMVAGGPDMLLGYPVWTDPNVAGQGSANRIMAYADWSSYYIRQVRDVEIELDRSRMILMPRLDRFKEYSRPSAHLVHPQMIQRISVILTKTRQTLAENQNNPKLMRRDRYTRRQ